MDATKRVVIGAASVLLTIAMVTGVLLMTGCGFAGGHYVGFVVTGLAPSDGNLGVTYDGASGGPSIVRLELLDPATGEVRFAEDVNILAGQAFELIDAPEGTFRVRAWFEDGSSASPEVDGAPEDLPVDIAADLDATVTFRHP